MSDPREASNAPSRLLNTLLSCLSQDWITLVFDLYRTLRRYVQQHSHEGMYQILNYDTTLELVDTKGKTAIFKKRQRIKFLQDYISTFQDYAWGDGKIFANYNCSPGTVVDRYQEGDRWNILISLRETKNNGDIEEFYIKRTALNGFTQPAESLQTEIRHQTKHLKVTIIFPKSRRCQRAILLQRSRHQSLVLGPEHFTTLPDGRQRLSWETTKIKRFEIYTTKWHW